MLVTRKVQERSREGDREGIILDSVDFVKDFGNYPKSNRRPLNTFKQDMINFSLSEDQFGLERSKGGYEESRGEKRVTSRGVVPRGKEVDGFRENSGLE